MTGSPSAPRLEASAAINLRFARVQRWGTLVATGAMVSAFALYVSGALPQRVPLDRLPGLLSQSSDALVRSGAVPTGWDWMHDLGNADTLSLGALVAMTLVVATGFVGLLPVLVRRREWALLALVLVQLALFALASGVLYAPGG